MPSRRAEGFTERVVATVAAIPPGTVATYGEVAVEAGFPVGASRAVGNVLQQVDGLPWWRVVTASGRLVPGSEVRHERLLVAEGVDVVGGRVRMVRRGRAPGGFSGEDHRGAQAPPSRAVANRPVPTSRSRGRPG